MLVSAADGGEGWRLLWTSLQGIPWGDPGKPSPPIIFNLVLDVVIRHWVTVVAPTEAGAEGLREMIQELAAFSYVGDGLVMSPQLERLQRDFNVLTNIFEWVVLHTNMRKTVSMACRPCYTPGGFLESAYTWNVTGSDPCTRSGCGGGYNDRSAGWRWWLYPLWRIARGSTTYTRGPSDTSPPPPPRGGIPKPIGYLSRRL